ncbi:hypothetical protein CTEN210_04777 [Chaetoceros tenuissimus]|uniref:Pentacotripeptide-repeat region of PRORP domain-containing protein n=1 Tax=Chaetoceros tenuissimus TaxID=426638 RepID=A0AAD3H2W3_9STRA|nr:hypothetical protein CTEN210_04777 [Chaetoceros tenuissimus]
MWILLLLGLQLSLWLPIKCVHGFDIASLRIREIYPYSKQSHSKERLHHPFSPSSRSNSICIRRSQCTDTKAHLIDKEESYEDWRQNDKLKNKLCDVFDFQATNENGEIVEDITYLANLQIKELVEKQKSEKHQKEQKQKYMTSQENEEYAIQAERILNRLEQLDKADTITYNLVINAFAKSSLPDNALHAEKILFRMERFHNEQVEIVKKWNHCMNQSNAQNALEECGIFDMDKGLKVAPRITVKPNVRTYSTVIDAYSRMTYNGQDGVDGAEAAQALLERLRMLYESTGDESMKPNVISYNSVINAWAKTGTVHGAQTAMKLLDTMEKDGIADVISYNAVIHAWARCGAKDSGEQAERILQRMRDIVEEEELLATDDCDSMDEISRGEYNDDLHLDYSYDGNFSRRTRIQPNIRTYSSVIDAWSRSSSPLAARRAESILEYMEEEFSKSGDQNVQPNTITYSTVINAHARSRDMENKASAALTILKRMENFYETGGNTQAKPSIITYNSVLNACATTYGVLAKKDSSSDVTKDDLKSDVKSPSQSLALGIVKEIFEELTSTDSNIKPDHFTYGTVLKACANLMSPVDAETIPFIRRVFEKCCEDGHVSFGVCFQLRQAAPVDLYRELIPEDAMDTSNGHFIIQHMPPEWSRNLKERKRSHNRTQ